MQIYTECGLKHILKKTYFKPSLSSQNHIFLPPDGTAGQRGKKRSRTDASLEVSLLRYWREFW